MDADAIHGAVEALDTLRTAGEQAQLVDEVVQTHHDGVVAPDGKDGDYDDGETDSEDDDGANGAATTVHGVLETQVVGPHYDIDLGRLGNFLLKCGINLVLPFVNGMMMGFGEIFAHEVCFRHNWQFARVSPPERMQRARRPAAAGVAAESDSVLLR